ncbi:22925_t:CDS:2 [Cetraspora pellucida]|uniref:22925_t:CDS:1 n=1 Tax=Cetraspora pellucida TaxID=1433469 RepID=A0A9N9A4L6_9GLOM|nr:22925_t:CDS:2 [Cetraspora pellucida]
MHRDLHSGNILLKEQNKAYITDLGLSITFDEKQGHIYGVLPYLASEVLKDERFTQAADIYSFGIIMIEISTGQRPFDGYNFDAELAIKICNSAPKCYVELANL